ncbi:uncharacterized protein PHACADRAFT_253850 [Phanerochaete carnosa HHB-10118-sp]|uniref:P-loop containing nucleoside triphosphate hydrolase protein n=1 Tax=Phanerochaete carnosa (strain HHB-10118-sp) TaxID=650164 RepID=K5WC94_PHACS|nr:uncharacterized protein PHACADRAFT_253850 [Phanerochaete carnosa HHB-10118-sp]EKM56629.1 hypothetical protein PHACADRAFT_253850 [Phanerochaete carnosa HHB-10118-sp]
MGRPSTEYDVETPTSTPTTSTTKLPLPAVPTLHSQPKPATPSIKLLFSFLTRHDLYFLVYPAILASMASGAIAPFMTLVIGNVFDAFANFPLSNATQSDKNTLRHDVGVTALELLGLSVGALVLSSLTSSLWIWTGERNLIAVRKRVYNDVTRKDLVWFDTRTGKDADDNLGAGGLMAKFTRETDEVRAATSLACGMLIQYLITTLVCLALGFSRSWALTLVILSAVPVLMVIQTVSQNLVSPRLSGERAHTATAATLVDRAVAAIATVKAFNAQSHEERNLSVVLDKLQACANGCLTVWGFTATLSHFAMMAMFVQGFWFGAKLVRSGTISAGDVMAVFWACLIATSNLQMCVPQLIIIAKGKFSMASLINLAQSSVEPTVGHSASTLYTPLKPARHTSTLRKIIPGTYKGGLELCDVTFAYPSRPDVPVLRDVNIFIPAQEMTFIVGASGSGKSTVGQLLLRMYHLHSEQGMIKFDDHDLAYLDMSWSREQIAGVSQTCILFDMTVHENVAMGLASPASKRRPEDVSREEVEAVCRAALMHQFISDLPNGYDTKLGNGGANLSGGQKQRLAIARALLRDPTILILDEATSALDPTSRVLVFEAIKKWRENKTTIVITHDLSQITAEDFVYVLKNGEIAEQGFRYDLETARDEFSRMLAVGFQERTDEDLAKEEVRLSAILEQTDAEQEEDLEAAGVTAKDLKRQSIYRPLTMNHWMFDVVADLTKPSVTSPNTAVTPTPNRTTHRISRFVPPEAFSEEPATPVSPFSLHRRQSLHIDIPSLASPPAARTISRRYSLQFTPTSPTSTSSFFSSTLVEDEDEDEKKLLEHRILHPSRSMSTLNAKAQVPKRERIKWDQGKLIELTDVKVEKAGELAEEPASSQPSFWRLMLDVWPTMPLKPLFVFGILVCLVSGAMTPAFSFVLSRLQFEVSTGATDVSAVNFFGGLSLAIAFGDGLLIGLKYFVMEYTAMDWVNKMRKTCINLVLAQDKKWFDKSENSPARLVQILIKDGDDSRSLIATVFAQTLVVTAMLGVGLIWALVEGWQLTLVGFALAPVFGLTMAVQTNLVAKCESRNKRAREEVAKGYYDAISNVRGIRAMGFESVFQEKFEKSADHALASGVRGAFVEGCTHGVASSLIYLSEAVLFYVGAVLVANGTYEYLRMVQVLNLVVFTVTIGSQLMSFTQRTAKSVQATQDFNQLLKLNKHTDESQGALRPPVAGDVLFSNVSFAYPERSDVPVLKDISLSLAGGECVAIVGSSGSGKSTIAALLQRLYEPSSGSVTIGHHPIHNTDVHYLRDHVAVVSQQPNLFDATIAENIAYGTQGLSREQIEAAARAANVHDFILSLPKGYETLVGENAALISGGQAQRLQIARALVRPSKILVLDECTSALDPANQVAVMETIRRAKVGRTTLMVTHKLQVMQMCDRILVIHEGALAEQGTYHELMEKRGIFAQLAHGGEWMD